MGTGAGWLAIELARSFPSLRVDGVDILDRALALARRNVDAAGVADRVALRAQDVRTLTDRGCFSAVWLPGPFLPRDVLVAALRTSARALAPDGVVIVGLYGDFGDEQSRLLAEIRTLRSGGHPWTEPELCAALTDAGLRDAQALDAPNALLRLVAARAEAPAQ